MPPTLRCGVFAALSLFAAPLASADPAALVIGNADYRRFADVSGGDEVRAIDRALTEAGFTLRSVRNADTSRTRGTIARFESDAESGEGAVVFLAGRFVHSATETYFLSTDAEVQTLESARREGIPLSTLTAVLAATPGLGVLALGDAGPFEVSVAYLAGGLGPVAAPQGVTVLAGAPGDVAAVLALLVEGEAVLDAEALAGANVALSGFVPRVGTLRFSDAEPTAPAREPDPLRAETAFWDAVRGIDSTEAYASYLDRYPRGLYAAEAEQRIAALADAPRREAEATEAALRLTRDQRREIQRALTLLGHDTRGIDGIIGPGTRSAIADWQGSEGFATSGYLDATQIRRLNERALARAAALEEADRVAAERATREDREFWRATGASGREDDLRRYLGRYPDGLFAPDALAELRAIEDLRRPRPSAVEELAWQRATEADTLAAYREHLGRYPDGAYAEAARDEIARLEEEARRDPDRQAAERGESAMNLSPTTRRTIEQRLAALDYDPGPADGVFDERTRRALLRYQQERRLPATGYMNDATMVRILADTVISIFD